MIHISHISLFPINPVSNVELIELEKAAYIDCCPLQTKIDGKWSCMLIWERLLAVNFRAHSRCEFIKAIKG